MAASVASPKGAMVAGVRFGSPPSARRASEPGTPLDQHLARATHGTSHGRELGESWVRGHSLPNNAAGIPRGSIGAVLDVNTPERWRPSLGALGAVDPLLQERSSLGAQGAIDPQWLPPRQHVSGSIHVPGRGEFGAILVQSAGAVLLGEDEHRDLIGEIPPVGECSAFKFLSKLTKHEAKKLLRAKGILLDDACVDEFITVFDVEESGVLSPTQLTVLARVLEREQWRVAKTKSGRATIEREHRRRVAEVKAKRALDNNVEQENGGPALSELSEQERLTVEQMAQQKTDDAARVAAVGAEHCADLALVRIVQTFEPEFRPAIRKILPAILQAVVCPGYPAPDPLAPQEVEAAVELGQSVNGFFVAALGETEGPLLAMRCIEEGFETVDELLAAGLCEGDLRELGLVQMKSRKKVIQLLARLAQQPLGQSVNDTLLPRRGGAAGAEPSDGSEYSYDSEEGSPAHFLRRKSEERSPAQEFVAMRKEFSSLNDDYGAERWEAHKAKREGREWPPVQEPTVEGTTVPEEQIGSLLGTLGTHRLERNLAKWRETEAIAATRIQCVFRGRNLRQGMQANIAKGLHPIHGSAYDFAVKYGHIKPSPGAHKQEAEHGHASIYKPHMVDRTTTIDLGFELKGSRWLDEQLGLEPETEPEPQPEPQPEPDADKSAFGYAKSEGLLRGSAHRGKKGLRRKAGRRKPSGRKVQPVDLQQERESVSPPRLGDDENVQAVAVGVGQQAGNDTVAEVNVAPPPGEDSVQPLQQVLPEPDLMSKVPRHVTDNLHYSCGTLLRLSKADFHLATSDHSDTDTDTSEVAYEPMRIVWNQEQFGRLTLLHAAFFLLGPVFGCPLAVLVEGKNGSQNLGMLPVCKPEPGKEAAARYINLLFCAQVAAWMVIMPLTACLAIRELPDVTERTSCETPPTIELVVPLILLVLHCTVVSIKYGLMPPAEIEARKLRHRLPVRLKTEQLWSWTLGGASSTKATLARELALSLHRQGVPSSRDLQSTVFQFCPTIHSRTPGATTTKELGGMQEGSTDGPSAGKYAAPPSESPADRLAGPKDAMQVMEVAVEAVMKRLLQFSLEPIPKGKWRKRLPAVAAIGLCLVVGGTPTLMRLQAAAPQGRNWMDFVAVACSGVASAGLLGEHAGYMWMASVDIRRRHLRLEVLGYMFQLNGKRHGIPRYNRFPLLVEDSPPNIHAWMDTRQVLCGYGESFLCRVQLLVAGWLLLDVLLVLAQVALVLHRSAQDVPLWLAYLCGYSTVQSCGVVFVTAAAQQYNALTAGHQLAFSVARRRALRESWKLEKETAEKIKLAGRLGVWIAEADQDDLQAGEAQWRQDARWQLAQIEKLYTSAAAELVDVQQTGVFFRIFGVSVGSIAVAVTLGLAALSLLSSAVLLTGGAALGRGLAQAPVCVQPQVACSWPDNLDFLIAPPAAPNASNDEYWPAESSWDSGPGSWDAANPSAVDIEMIFDVDLLSLDAGVFTDALTADLAAILGVDVTAIEVLGLRSGSVVVTIRLSPDAYASLLARFSAGTLPSIAGFNVHAIASVQILRDAVSRPGSFSDSGSGSWYDDVDASPPRVPCGGSCPENGTCVGDICYSPVCFENATVFIDPWRTPANTGNPPPYDSRFHVDATGIDSVAFVWQSLADYPLITFAVWDESTSGSWNTEPEPEPWSCGSGATTLGGLAPYGSACSFPFIHFGETFNECTDRDNNGTFWCAVYVGQGPEVTGTRSWGNCDVARCESLEGWPVVPDVYCELSKYIASFQTRQEAEEGCTEANGCFGIYDHRCDGLSTRAEFRGSFHTCSTPVAGLRSSSTGGCVYERYVPTTLGAKPLPGTLPAMIPLAPPAAEKSCGAWFSGWLSSYQLPPPPAVNQSLNVSGSWGPDDFGPPESFSGIGIIPRPGEYTQQATACFTSERGSTCAHHVALSVTSCPADVRYSLPEAPVAGFHGGGYCAEAVNSAPCGAAPTGWESISGTCSSGGAWPGMECPLSCLSRHYPHPTVLAMPVTARCVDGSWRTAQYPFGELPPRCVPNQCEGEPTFIPHFSSSSGCSGTLSGAACAFRCGGGFEPTTTGVCHQGEWSLVDAAAEGGGCREMNATARTVVPQPEEGTKWYEILGFVGDKTPLLPLLMVTVPLLLWLLVRTAKRTFRVRRAKILEERSRTCRPIDAVGHRFTVGAKRFGTLPPVITDPVERIETQNLATYTHERGVPGAVSGGEPLAGQGSRLPPETPPRSIRDTEWMPEAGEPSQWLSGPPKVVEPGVWAAVEAVEDMAA